MYIIKGAHYLKALWFLTGLASSPPLFYILLLYRLEILFIVVKINLKLELDSSCCYLYSVGLNFVRFFIAMIVLKLLLLFMLQVRCHSQNTTAKAGK